jgi:hypothetical protein
VRDARKRIVRKIENALEEIEKEVDKRKGIAAWKAAKAKEGVAVETHETEVYPEDSVATVELPQIPRAESSEASEATVNDHTALAEPQYSEPESTVADSTSSFIPCSINPDIVDPIQAIVSSTTEAAVEFKTTDADGDAVSISLDDVPRVSLVVEEVNVAPSLDDPAPNDEDASTQPNSLSSEHNSESVSLLEPATGTSVLTPSSAGLTLNRNMISPEVGAPMVSAAAADSALTPIPSSSHSVAVADEEELVLASSRARPSVPTVPTEVAQLRSPSSESSPGPGTEEEPVAADAFLLAPPSLSMSFSPPTPLEDDDDAVLVDSEHEDSWSEVDA